MGRNSNSNLDFADLLGAAGDVNYDASVDSRDLILILNHFGIEPTPPTSAPVVKSAGNGLFDPLEATSPILFDCYDVAPHGASKPHSK